MAGRLVTSMTARRRLFMAFSSRASEEFLSTFVSGPLRIPSGNHFDHFPSLFLLLVEVWQRVAQRAGGSI